MTKNLFATLNSLWFGVSKTKLFLKKFFNSILVVISLFMRNYVDLYPECTVTSKAHGIRNM